MWTVRINKNIIIFLMIALLWGMLYVAVYLFSTHTNNPNKKLLNPYPHDKQLVTRLFRNSFNQDRIYIDIKTKTQSITNKLGESTETGWYYQDNKQKLAMASGDGEINSFRNQTNRYIYINSLNCWQEQNKTFAQKRVEQQKYSIDKNVDVYRLNENTLALRYKKDITSVVHYDPERKIIKFLAVAENNIEQGIFFNNNFTYERFIYNHSKLYPPSKIKTCPDNKK